MGCTQSSMADGPRNRDVQASDDQNNNKILELDPKRSDQGSDRPSGRSGASVASDESSGESFYTAPAGFDTFRSDQPAPTNFSFSVNSISGLSTNSISETPKEPTKIPEFQKLKNWYYGLRGAPAPSDKEALYKWEIKNEKSIHKVLSAFEKKCDEHRQIKGTDQAPYNTYWLSKTLQKRVEDNPATPFEELIPKEWLEQNFLSYKYKLSDESFEMIFDEFKQDYSAKETSEVSHSDSSDDSITPPPGSLSRQTTQRQLAADSPHVGLCAFGTIGVIALAGAYLVKRFLRVRKQPEDYLYPLGRP